MQGFKISNMHNLLQFGLPCSMITFQHQPLILNHNYIHHLLLNNYWCSGKDLTITKHNSKFSSHHEFFFYKCTQLHGMKPCIDLIFSIAPSNFRNSINVAPISIIKNFVEINFTLYMNNKPSYTPSHALFKLLWTMAKLKNRQ